MNSKMTDEHKKGKSLRELRHEDADDKVDESSIDEENPFSDSIENQSVF